jgi:hypothetical protein
VEAGSISAKISWTTDKLSDSRVFYGLTENMEESEYSSNLVKPHSISLQGLAIGATYYFKAESNNEYGGAETSVQTFSTKACSMGECSPAPNTKYGYIKSMSQSGNVLSASLYSKSSTNTCSKLVVDWNRDCSFGGGEIYPCSCLYVRGTTQVQCNFNPPKGAAGDYRARFSIMRNYYPADDGCGFSGTKKYGDSKVLLITI